MTDPLFRRLAGLPVAQPDQARADRVRASCHARLSRTRRVGRAPLQRRPRGMARMWGPLVAGLSGVYLTEVVRQAFRFYGIL